MKCKVCGYEFNSDRAYCPMCGSKTKEELRSRADEEMSWNTYDFPKPKRPKDIEMSWPDMDIPAREHITVMKKDGTEGFITTASDDIPRERELPKPPSSDYWTGRQTREQRRSEPARRSGEVVAERPKEECEFTSSAKPSQGAWRMPEMQPQPSWNIFDEEAPRQSPPKSEPQQTEVPRQDPPQAEQAPQAAPVFAQPVFIPQYPDQMQVAWTIPPQGSGQPVYLAQPAQQIYITTTPPGYTELKPSEESKERLAYDDVRREDFVQRREDIQLPRREAYSGQLRTEHRPQRHEEFLTRKDLEDLAPKHSAADIFEGSEPEHYARMLKEKIVARAKEGPEDPFKFEADEFDDLQPDEDGRFPEKFFTFHKKNEEFQQLLNEEYERLRKSRGGDDEIFDTPAQSFFNDPVSDATGDMLSEFEKMLLSGTRDIESEATLALNKNRLREANRYVAKEAFERARKGFEPEEATVELSAPEREAADEDRGAVSSEHKRKLEAMAKAREAYFASLSGEDYSFKSPAKQAPAQQPAAPQTPKDLEKTRELTFAEMEEIQESAAPSEAEAGPSETELGAAQIKDPQADDAETFQDDGDLGIPRMPEEPTDSSHAGDTVAAGLRNLRDAFADEELYEDEGIDELSGKEDLEEREDDTIPIDEYFELEGESPDNGGKAAAMSRLLDTADDERTTRGRSHTFLSFLIAVILVIALAEGVTIGLRYFAPESQASIVMTDAEQKIVKFFSKGFDSIKGIFVKNDSEKPQEPEPESESKGPAETSFDLSSIVEKYNKNIEKVVEDLGIGYDSQKNYEVEGLAGSALLDNNEEKEKVFATLIAYNSSWIDYVHSNGRECLDYLKADGSAYRSAVNFDKVGLIEEKFEKLSIGEIRVNGDFYYVFAAEKISVTSEGVTTKSDESLIYQLVKVGDTLKIKDYYTIN
ncbi:MAG: hypothetical protein GX975_00670 [Clostridiales bacterium]|nr:hypothetical protein [Clostridiales bacterium]